MTDLILLLHSFSLVPSFAPPCCLCLYLYCLSHCCLYVSTSLSHYQPPVLTVDTCLTLASLSCKYISLPIPEDHTIQNIIACFVYMHNYPVYLMLMIVLLLEGCSLVLRLLRSDSSDIFISVIYYFLVVLLIFFLICLY